MKGLGLANHVTLSRAVATVVVWILLVIGTPVPSTSLVIVTFILFSLAAATDFVDGMLARRTATVSVFGRIADPLVDKMLTIGTLIVLQGQPAARAIAPPWMVAVMLVRELLVTALRAQVEVGGGNFQAAWVGKWKMILQAIAAGAAMLASWPTSWAHARVPLFDALPGGAARWNLGHLLAWAALLLTLFSLWPYVRRARTLLRPDAP